MEYTDQSLRLRLMMWIVEKRVFVSVCITVKVMVLVLPQGDASINYRNGFRQW